MSHLGPLLDFTELTSSIKGEVFEQLVRLIGKAKGLSYFATGRGPDGGYDMFFTEERVGPVSHYRVKWLVSCKDNAVSGKAVGENDLPSIENKLVQHKANGFLLATTTVPSSTAKSVIDSHDISNGGKFHTAVWDSADITAFLLEPECQHLLKQFFPTSYKRYQKYSGLEEIVTVLREHLPMPTFLTVEKVLAPFLPKAPTASGNSIWPYDEASAQAIDHIFASLFSDRDLKKAADSTENIEFDAFIAMLEYLYANDHRLCKEYLFTIIDQEVDGDLRFNAAQFLFDNYELEPDMIFSLAQHLDSEAIKELYWSEVSQFVAEELIQHPDDFGFIDLLEDEGLPSSTSISDMKVSYIEFEAKSNHIQYSGDMELEFDLWFEGDSAGSTSGEGTFSGYFNRSGMFVTDAKITNIEWADNNHLEEDPIDPPTSSTPNKW